ncbi:MAG: DnaD domain protein [Chloroflexi bacterium]|nr:DnaD domain protein [Chloroflexota bacterium]MYK62164.1 DnaD domain protein [Chloroflexota bacterium]
MPPQPIKGFPLPDDFATTRVPNAVLGRVLSTIEDADEIKLILRAIWLLEHQRGYPRYITRNDLRRDRILSVTIPDQSDFDRILQSAIERGVFVEVSINDNSCLMFNTESARRASIEVSTTTDNLNEDDNGWETAAVSTALADAFRAYEENIGILSPMIRQSILAALEDFTDEDITHAVRIAVENESRSWSFVAGVLRRWARDGIPHERTDGTTGGGSDRERISQAELRRYLDAQRKRDRAG